MKHFNEDVPIYIQVRQEIEKAIINGAIPEGEMVPSIRKVAQDYKINPQTVSNALSELVSEGIIFKKRGVGFFVKDKAKKILRKQKAEQFRKQELHSTIKKGYMLGIKKREFIDAIEKVYNGKGE